MVGLIMIGIARQTERDQASLEKCISLLYIDLKNETVSANLCSELKYHQQRRFYSKYSSLITIGTINSYNT